MTPIHFGRTVFLDQIDIPTLRTIQLDRRQRTAFEIRKHSLAVRNRRSIATGSITMSPGIFLAKASRPLFFAHGVDAKDRILSFFGRRQINLISDRDRR